MTPDQYGTTLHGRNVSGTRASQLAAAVGYEGSRHAFVAQSPRLDRCIGPFWRMRILAGPRFAGGAVDVAIAAIAVPRPSERVANAIATAAPDRVHIPQCPPVRSSAAS